jgi:hypothetical protein
LAQYSAAMLDRTRRLVSGVVDLAKDAVGPGKRVEEGRAAQRAWALIEGRPEPNPKEVALLEGLCAFDPRHGRAVETLPVTTEKNTADVPVCRGCAVLIGKGDA